MMGTVITFYSYKGGVGRSMAVANIAALLVSWGKTVLVVDWDLEAPGIEHFFFKRSELAEIRSHRGLIDLLTDLASGRAKAGTNCCSDLMIEARLPKVSGSVKILTSGARSQGYFRSVRQLDVKDFYENKDGGRIVEQLRDGWKSEYDFVLVDSRTGITDVGGICTIHLPDVLAIVFAATEQSLTGAVEVAAKASVERQKLPFDRSVVPVLPIPGRFDTQTEQKISREWLECFEQSLSSLYNVWLPKQVNRRAFLELTKIPYAPYFSFGEGLPVIEQGTTDPASLGFAYETVAALVANRLQNADLIISNRDEFIRLARLRFRLPKTPVRELPLDFVVYVELANAGSLRSFLEVPSGSSKAFEGVLEDYQAVIADALDAAGGAVAMSDGYSFLLAFPSLANAIKFAIEIQESLVVSKPIDREPVGQLRARVAIYGKTTRKQVEMGSLLKGAAKIASRARADQILISSQLLRSFGEPVENLEFRERQEMIDVGPDGGGEVKLVEVERVVPLDLTADERASLFKQNPATKSGGGFQAFLVGLQESVIPGTDRLELRLSDRERIARYAHDYKGGGWQGRLRKIFGRTLGENLGRL